jgi:hypothetical protein
MAMIKCPEPDCNNMVSDQATACPKCGRPVRRIGVDRLRLEYEKRQRSIQALQTKIVGLSRERQDMFELDEQMRKNDNHTADPMNRAFSISDEIKGIDTHPMRKP